MHNYNFIQKILHNFYLGNKFIKKCSFEIEKILFLKKNFKIDLEKHIFITSLPRSGTTALFFDIFFYFLSIYFSYFFYLQLQIYFVLIS